MYLFTSSDSFSHSKVLCDFTNMQNCLDIVATQGVHLIPRTNTPVFKNSTHDEEHFAITLSRKLYAIQVEQIVRRVMYRQAADEWPIGHTPPEVKEQYEAEMKAREEQAENSSSKDDDDDDIDGDNDNDNDKDDRAILKKDVRASNSPCLSFQRCELAKSPISANSTLPITNGKRATTDVR